MVGWWRFRLTAGLLKPYEVTQCAPGTIVAQFFFTRVFAVVSANNSRPPPRWPPSPLPPAHLVLCVGCVQILNSPQRQGQVHQGDQGRGPQDPHRLPPACAQEEEQEGCRDYRRVNVHTMHWDTGYDTLDQMYRLLPQPGLCLGATAFPLRVKGRLGLTKLPKIIEKLFTSSSHLMPKDIHLVVLIHGLWGGR